LGLILAKKNKAIFSLDLYVEYTYNVAVEFQWDRAKAKANLKKHGIEFADAIGVFEDEDALTIEDQKATGEQRFITLGMDFLGRILVVVYTYRSDSIRIISARKATERERKHYARRI